MNVIYRGMNRVQLDAAYNNTQAVADFPAVMQDFQTKSKAVYATRKVLQDLAYHTMPATKFDYFPSGSENSPTFIFIHGGYWQNCKKEDFAFIASGILDAGINVILAEYTLAPEASMTRIVQEIGLLLDFLQLHAAEFNLVPGKICLGGHSAGGHLTAMHLQHPVVSHAMPISALVDLLPISLSWLNDKLSLSPQEIEQFSPANHIHRAGVPTHIHVGGGELSELIRHSKDLYARMHHVGTDVLYQEIGDDDHFSQLNEFQRADGVLVQSLQTLFNR